MSNEVRGQKLLQGAPEQVTTVKKHSRPSSVPPRNSIVRTIVKPRITFNYINAMIDLGLE